VLFNSLDFILLFMPIVLLTARVLHGNALLFWISFSSAVFYAFAGHVWFLIPMAITTTLDFWIGGRLTVSSNPATRKFYLVISLVCNLGLLAYFKYSGLLLHTILSAETYFGRRGLPTDIQWALTVILPAGISFYTFQTISYVIDIYRGNAKREPNFLKYLSFVAFFPHLVAGPLTRHNQLLPQLTNIADHGIKPRWEEGVYLFVIGLAKKVLIADRIANGIDPLITDIGNAGMLTAWIALFGFAFQIYFDFSGYSDMAIGLGRLFGIELPRNFNSPYQARNPSEFWQRWHITLSRWLRDYLYIPLGGNRCSHNRRQFNLMTTMILGGLWHGGNWTFAIWGLIQGALLILYHSSETRWNTLSQSMQRNLTFLCICLAWVPFRSDSLAHMFVWYGAMAGNHGVIGPVFHPSIIVWLVPMEALALAIVFLARNSLEMNYLNFSKTELVLLAVTATISILMMNYSSRFLYFQF
jgi:alginate O-acetyltransferase complex protein AlgI